MSCLRFNLLVLIVCLFTLNSYANKFSSKQCLDASYNTFIKHEGKLFGLIKNELWIMKNNCIVEVKYKEVLEDKWLIDVCREPVHIKHTSKGTQSVYKRSGSCSGESDFCKNKDLLLELLQDHGLIFAEGERESLKSSHGQTYCAFLLVKEYLNEGTVFSKYMNSLRLLPYEKQAMAPALEKKPDLTPVSTPAEIPDYQEKADSIVEDLPKF